MRLWSLHPQYLDVSGLVALWREGLLARAVLCGATRGYRHHPQLTRFRSHRRPIACIDTYLATVCDEAARRGYRFDRSKLGRGRIRTRLTVTSGQLTFEWMHLDRKLHARRSVRPRRPPGDTPEPHPLFKVVPGPVADWEKAACRQSNRLSSADGP